MRNIIINTISLFVLSSCCLGQNQFAFKIGGEREDSGISIVRSTDDGFVVAGYTNSFGQGNGNLLLMKFDSNGVIQWCRAGDIGLKYVLPSLEYALSASHTIDGGYALTGCTYKYGAGYDDLFLTKLDAKGSMKWFCTIGGKKGDFGMSVIQTKDHGLVVVGGTSSFGANRDVYFVKLDSSGSFSSQTIGVRGNSDEWGNSVIQTADSGYIVLGSTKNSKAPSHDLLIIKYNAWGYINRVYTAGGIGDIYAKSIISTSDSGFAIAGYIYEYGKKESDVILIKFKPTGDIEWARSIGGTENEKGCGLVQASDSGLVLTGWTRSYGGSEPGGANFLLAKFDKSGTLEWFHTGGGIVEDFGYSIIKTGDNGYTLTGQLNGNVLLAKFDSDGEGCIGSRTEVTPIVKSINLSIVNIEDPIVNRLPESTIRMEYPKIKKIKAKRLSVLEFQCP